MSVAPSKKRVRKATAQTCALQMAPTPTDRQLRIALMMEIAKDSGFICQAQTEYANELSTSIASRLVHRSGMSVYQSVNFTIPLFARDAALEIFGATGRTTMSDHMVSWKLSTIAECALVLEALMANAPSTSCCAALTRALRSESEVTSQVLATIMPTLEATWATQAKGGCHLKVNFLYVLTDGDGELHAPKDEERRELDLGELEQDMRARVLVDAQQLIDQGVPLSSGWYRQLGLTERASEVAAMEAAGTKPPKQKKLKAGKAGVTKKGHFNVSRIVEERKSTGKAKKHFLVEWEGYHPSWESWRILGKVGSPLQTWECLGVVHHTEALYAWRGWELPAAS
jgi:hypothetical protein